MPLISIPNQSYRWLLAELTVVVLSILLAFQIEEWRVSRSERSIEIANLEAILSDLDDRERTTSQVIYFARETQQGISEFISLMQNTQNLDGDEFITSKLSTSKQWLWEKSRLNTRGYFSFVNMSLVSDSQLRDSLNNYYMGFEFYFDEKVSQYNEIWRQSKVILFEEFEYSPVENFGNSPNFVWRIEDPNKPFPSNPGFVPAMGRLYDRAEIIIGIAETGNSILTDELRPALEKYLAELR
ncbi:MAG: hypothetical protein COA96_06945 [SAR86 cluster bacterium]|uniref:Uncharacterized protein n=1 Tax=SAR86 cluster bacterium TaxID=2030880 RepID=A0A2A5B2G3_9GAMM|nr:MAG: hypothetical protein COA96_06945 [SAR86 cluster bacterium]